MADSFPDYSWFFQGREAGSFHKIFSQGLCIFLEVCEICFGFKDFPCQVREKALIFPGFYAIILVNHEETLPGRLKKRLTILYLL